MYLQHLPLECLQDIAHNLSDKDLAVFRLICQQTCSAIDAQPAHFWMYRYLHYFDRPLVFRTLDQFRESYQVARSVLRSPPIFRQNSTAETSKCLRILCGLIVEANPTTDECEFPHSKNLAILDRFIENSNILQCILGRTPVGTPRDNRSRVPTHSRKGKGAKSLQLVQLVLSARSLSFHNGTPSVFSFEQSQQQVYESVVKAPLFGGANGMEVNINWALHCVNFFRNHMLRASESTLYPSYKDLSEIMDGTEMPQLWKRRLSNVGSEVHLGKHWKGSYAYLLRNEIEMIRSGEHIGSTQFQDRNVDMGDKAIQSMHIEFPETFKNHWWPLFERELKATSFHKRGLALNGPRKTRSTSSQAFGPEDLRPAELVSSYFEGGGYDEEDFYGAGCINTLPPQYNIPGWKRMTMMKYFEDSNGSLDMDALWAYEGIVLPGDQIIVGRWWAPDRRDLFYSGPFILWNTDCAEKFKDVQQEIAEEIMLKVD